MGLLTTKCYVSRKDAMDLQPHKPHVQEYLFQDDGRIPNNPTLPLLVYSEALATTGELPSICEELFRNNGWGGSW